MKKLKKVVILILVILMLWGNLISAEASSFKFEVKLEKEEVEAGDTVKIDMRVEDIEVEDGINVVEGNLEYDKTVFKSATFSNNNDWKTTYNEK